MAAGKGRGVLSVSLPETRIKRTRGRGGKERERERDGRSRMANWFGRRSPRELCVMI